MRRPCFLSTFCTVAISFWILSFTALSNASPLQAEFDDSPSGIIILNPQLGQQLRLNSSLDIQFRVANGHSATLVIYAGGSFLFHIATLPVTPSTVHHYAFRIPPYFVPRDDYQIEVRVDGYVERVTFSFTEPVRNPIRLSPGPSKGLLQVYHNHEWGTICDDGFTDTAAGVACRQLGFARAVQDMSCSYHDHTRPCGRSTRIWLTYVTCKRGMVHLESCEHRAWGQHSCRHSEDVVIECTNRTSAPTISTPLAGTGYEHGATVHVRYDLTHSAAPLYRLDLLDAAGRLARVISHGLVPEGSVSWGVPGDLPVGRYTLCIYSVYDPADNATRDIEVQEHNVIAITYPRPGERLECGYHTARWSMTRPTHATVYFRNGDTRVRLGTTSNSHMGFHLSSSLHERDNYVLEVHTDTDTQYVVFTVISIGVGAPLQLVPGPDAGRLEVHDGRKWGTICDDGFYTDSAHVACRQLNFTRAKRKGNCHYSHFDCGRDSILLSEVRCRSARTLYLSDCPHDRWGGHRCTHREDVVLECVRDRPLLDFASLPYHSTFRPGDVLRFKWEQRAAGPAFRADLLDAANHSVKCLGVSTPGIEEMVTMILHIPDKALNGEYALQITPLAPHPVVPPARHSIRVHNPVSVIHLNEPRSGSTLTKGNAYTIRWTTTTTTPDTSDSLFIHIRLLSEETGEWERITTLSDSGRYIWSIPNQHDAYPAPGRYRLIVESYHDSTVSSSAIVQIEAEGPTACRLVPGPAEGRLEVHHKGEWGTVCNAYSFSESSAQMICRSLGYKFGMSRSCKGSECGTGRIWLSRLQCDSRIHTLNECSHSPWGDTSCGHSSDVALNCSNGHLEINYPTPASVLYIGKTYEIWYTLPEYISSSVRIYLNSEAQDRDLLIEYRAANTGHYWIYLPWSIEPGMWRLYIHATSDRHIAADVTFRITHKPMPAGLQLGIAIGGLVGFLAIAGFVAFVFIRVRYFRPLRRAGTETLRIEMQRKHTAARDDNGNDDTLPPVSPPLLDELPAYSVVDPSPPPTRPDGDGGDEEGSARGDDHGGDGGDPSTASPAATELDTALLPPTDPDAAFTLGPLGGEEEPLEASESSRLLSPEERTPDGLHESSHGGTDAEPLL